jgi:FkbM family methyltransferase
MKFGLTRLIHKLCTSLEKRAAYLCGKGYGTATIKQEVRMVSSLLGSSPRLAVDIGGNVGDYSEELIRVFPDLELHVFEPATTNLARLKTRFAQHAKVSLQQAALSDAAGRMTLFADRDGSGMASLAQRQLSHLDIRFTPMEEVEVRRFDSYWRQALSGRFIDVVKIDVEGYELMVLRGFGDAIRNVRVLQFEFGGTNIDTKVFFRDLWCFFEEAGFDLYRITPLGVMRIERYHERDELFIIANYIAVNRSLRG